MQSKRLTAIYLLVFILVLLFAPLAVAAAEEAAPAAPAAAAAPAVTDAPDPGGTTTGTVKDVTAKEAGKPTLVEIWRPWAITRSPSTLPGP